LPIGAQVIGQEVANHAVVSDGKISDALNDIVDDFVSANELRSRNIAVKICTALSVDDGSSDVRTWIVGRWWYAKVRPIYLWTSELADAQQISELVSVQKCQNDRANKNIFATLSKRDVLWLNPCLAAQQLQLVQAEVTRQRSLKVWPVLLHNRILGQTVHEANTSRSQNPTFLISL
jgi:hypothetical protein